MYIMSAEEVLSGQVGQANSDNQRNAQNIKRLQTQIDEINSKIQTLTDAILELAELIGVESEDL